MFDDPARFRFLKFSMAAERRHGFEVYNHDKLCGFAQHLAKVKTNTNENWSGQFCCRYL